MQVCYNVSVYCYGGPCRFVSVSQIFITGFSGVQFQLSSAMKTQETFPPRRKRSHRAMDTCYENLKKTCKEKLHACPVIMGHAL